MDKRLSDKNGRAEFPALMHIGCKYRLEIADLSCGEYTYISSPFDFIYEGFNTASPKAARKPLLIEAAILPEPDSAPKADPEPEADLGPAGSSTDTALKLPQTGPKKWLTLLIFILAMALLCLSLIRLHSERIL